VTTVQCRIVSAAPFGPAHNVYADVLLLTVCVCVCAAVLSYRAVQLKNSGDWQQALALFEEYRQVLTGQLRETNYRGDMLGGAGSLTPSSARALTPAGAATTTAEQHGTGAAAATLSGETVGKPGSDAAAGGGTGSGSGEGRPLESRFEIKDQGSPALPQTFPWEGLLELPEGKADHFGNHRHLRPTTAPAAIRQRGESLAAGASATGAAGADDDVLLRALSTEPPEFWEQLALKRECRQKYGLQGTVGFLSQEVAST
jgi:hypothetical protein